MILLCFCLSNHIANDFIAEIPSLILSEKDTFIDIDNGAVNMVVSLILLIDSSQENGEDIENC